MKSWVSCLIVFVALISAVYCIPDTGTGLGRAHIYYAGNYGSCNSYQATEKDANGPCGATADDPCISTSKQNAGEDCGKCFKVTNVKLGTVTYLKIVDTDGSDATFEMTYPAWKHLCPKACTGYGVCEAASTTCQFGEVDVMYVQSDTVKWERYECGSAPAPPTPVTEAPVTEAPKPTESTKSKATKAPVTTRAPVTETTKSKATEATKSKATEATKSKATEATQGQNPDYVIVDGKKCCINSVYAPVPGMGNWCVINGCPPASGICSWC